MKTENTVENVIKELVDAGQLAGAAALAWLNGEVVHAAAVGRRKLANELPVEGESLGEVLARRVFAPLGMRDTDFVVSREKRDRRAALCGFDDEGRLTTLTATPGRHALDERPEDMPFESGGQGLWSTLDDYLV